MKVFYYGLALLLAATLASPALAEEFEVCIDPTTVVVSNGFNPGSVIVYVGTIVPGGTIPAGGTGSDCSDIVGLRIGTFFARGNIVSGLPAAAADDLAYVDWQFRIDGKGTLDTSGLVKTTLTYPQTIVGATGGLGPAKGQALVRVLDASGFQFRLILPKKPGQEK